MKKIILVLLVLVIITSFHLIAEKQTKISNTIQTIALTPDSLWQKYNGAGNVSFDYPSTWFLGGTDITHGTFQIYNFSKTENSRTFTGEMTKIEIVQLQKDMISDFEDYKQSDLCATCLAANDDHPSTFISYAVHIPDSNNYVLATLYGDMSKKWILERIAMSMMFMEK
jgi:hypothetical protein